MRIGKLIREVVSAGLLLTAGFHSSLAMPNRTQSQRETIRSHGGVKNIVLVHGAWADGSSWSGVIPLLEKDGYHVLRCSFLLPPLQTMTLQPSVRSRASLRHTQVQCCWLDTRMEAWSSATRRGTIPTSRALSTLLHLPPTLVSPRCPCSKALKTPSPLTQFLVFDPAFNSSPFPRKAWPKPLLKTCRNLSRRC